jgi:hypothetical protein
MVHANDGRPEGGPYDIVRDLAIWQI